MKMNKSLLFPLFICLMILNIFLLTRDGFSRDSNVNKETRKIYHILEREINSMNGVITGRRGRITNLFAIDIDFSKSNNYDRISIFNKLEELGFLISSRDLNSVIYCKGKSGFLISGNQSLTIDYRYNMSYCSD